MPWSMRTEGGQVLVVRQRDKKVVGRHKDRKRALAQMKVLYSLEKAQFASRSEAGRYAANMRWKGNVKEDISQKVTIGFEPRGSKNDSGTVWATDKETGKAVGALSFDGNFIAKIYVLKDYRRKGIASFLYEEAKKRNGGVEMKADDYTVSGAGFMSAVTGEEVYQTGDNSWVGIEWKYWLERLDRDATVNKSLIDLLKASFDGDRSAAGRYAANQRWKGQGDKKLEGVKSLKSAIVDAFPKMMKLKSKPWWLGDTEQIRMMVEMTFSQEMGERAFSGNITLADYSEPALAGGNCGIASAEVGAFLITTGLAKYGEVFMREVGEPSYSQHGGSHFVTQIGPKDSDDAIIVDFTLRQFSRKADFPWVGTVKEYRETGYPIDANGNVVYPWNEPGFKGDTDSK